MGRQYQKMQSTSQGDVGNRLHLSSFELNTIVGMIADVSNKLTRSHLGSCLGGRKQESSSVRRDSGHSGKMRRRPVKSSLPTWRVPHASRRRCRPPSAPLKHYAQLRHLRHRCARRFHASAAANGEWRHRSASEHSLSLRC